MPLVTQMLVVLEVELIRRRQLAALFAASRPVSEHCLEAREITAFLPPSIRQARKIYVTCIFLVVTCSMPFSVWNVNTVISADDSDVYNTRTFSKIDLSECHLMTSSNIAHRKRP